MSQTLSKHSRVLRFLSFAGARERYGDPVSPEIEERIDHELDIINEAGFPEYFLIVWDLMKHLRSNRIPVGPGRGSVCGSVVAYCLRITDVDPLRFDIPFERFLHLERVAMPDIDLDICQARRDEALEYIKDKYGHENSTQIITFGTMQARGVIRDVFRVCHVREHIDYVDQDWIDDLATLIPEGSGADQVLLSDFVDMESGAEFWDRMKRVRASVQDELGIDIWETCLTLEGLRRHGSVHAAGMVVADRPMIEVAPLYKRNADAERQIQYDYHDAEDIGLLKLDVLGLRTVTVVGDASEMVRERVDPDFDILDVPLDDEPTYELLQRGDTVGVFQLEGEGITHAVEGIKPDRFDDIISAIALYRPGPMEQLGSYIDRKHGKERVTYAHPDLKPALERTYGLIVFQEQVMGIARTMAGYTPGEADIFRKAIGKKIPELIEEQISEFTDRAIDAGYDSELVEEIGRQIAYFGRYGFNFGHATGYAFLTYWTAYLKANYPLAFYTAILNSYLGKLDRIAVILADAKKHDVNVLPPDINESDRGFSISQDGHGIRFGIEAVKGLGESMVTDILEERDSKRKNLYVYKTEVRSREDGSTYKASIRHTERTDNEPRSYDGPWDFCNRLSHIPINAKISLAAAGAFGADLDHRRRLVAAFPDLNKQAKKGRSFDLSDWQDPIPSETEIMKTEREVMGFYVTRHPLEHYEDLIAAYDAHMDGAFERLPSSCRIAGVVTDFRRHQSVKGEMAWVTVETGILGMPEITVFNDVWKKLRHRIEENQVVVVTGKRQDHPKFGLGFIARSVKVVDRARPDANEILVMMPDADVVDLHLLNSETSKNGIGADLKILIGDGERVAFVATDKSISATGASIRNLQQRWSVMIDPGRKSGLPWQGGKLQKARSPYSGSGSDRTAVWDTPLVRTALDVLGGRVVSEMEVSDGRV